MSSPVRALMLLSVGLVASAARAEATLIGVPATAPLEVRGAFELGTRGLGLGALWPERPEEPRWALALEADWASAGSVLSLRAAPLWSLWHGGSFALSAQAGLSLDTVWKGPFDVGGGPFGGLTLGLGSSAVEVFLGTQAGAELFAVTGGPRFPLRALLGVRAGVGPLFVEAVGRGGLDLEPGQAFTVRAEAVALVGVRGG